MSIPSCLFRATLTPQRPLFPAACCHHFPSPSPFPLKSFITTLHQILYRPEARPISIPTHITLLVPNILVSSKLCHSFCCLWHPLFVYCREASTMSSECPQYYRTRLFSPHYPRRTFHSTPRRTSSGDLLPIPSQITHSLSIRAHLVDCEEREKSTHC